MKGITRYMRILSLFDEAHPSWTVSEMAEALDTSASTLYRLIREMVEVEMLESTVESRYRLGPFFVEYYRRIALSDPLIRSGGKFLDPLAQQVPIPCVTILARLYGKAVMCVAEVRGPSATFDTSYEVGRPMPMLRGATSRAVLSTLPKRALTKLLDDLDDEDRSRAEAVIADIAAIRRRGICETHGEVDAPLVGIAAPVRNQGLGINASITVIVEQARFTEDRRPQIYAAVTSTAQLVETFMSETTG